MTRVVETGNEHCVAHDAASPHGSRPAPVYYAIARHRNKGPELLCFPLGFGEETLPVFCSREAAQSFVLSNGLGPEWYARASSTGELVSLLLGPYADVERVLLDPPGGIVEEDAPAHLVRWDDFIDHLLG